MSDESIPDLAPEEARKAKKRASNHEYWLRHHVRLVAKRRAYLHEYHERHRERILAHQRIQQKQKRDEDLPKARAAEKVRQERIRAQSPEKPRARGQRYRAKRKALTGSATHPGSKQWREQHPEQTRAHGAKRRALKRNAPVNDFTAKQWRALCKAAGYRCAYCGQKFPFKQLTQDHITPLVKGGSHTLANILPACGSCNSRKHARDVPKPVQPFLLLDEGAAD